MPASRVTHAELFASVALDAALMDDGDTSFNDMDKTNNIENATDEESKAEYDETDVENLK